MPKAISYEEMKILFQKMETQMCKIECHDGGHGTGFFCNIQYDWNLIKVLMTNNHVLNEEDISLGKKIRFSLKDETIYFEIEIDELRTIYTNKDYDITIIEIKKNDKIDQKAFLDVDNEIFNENIKELLIKKDIYLLHYPKGEKMKFSKGQIQSVNEDNYTIRHLCDSSEGSSGGPIINANDFKVIGIHKGGSKGKNYNLGTLLKEPIEKFFEKIKKREKLKNKNNKKSKKEQTKEKNENIINYNSDANILTNEINKEEIINEEINEISIQYKIDIIEYSKDIRIFGDKFVQNNKGKCIIILNGNEFELCSCLNVNKNLLINNLFEIKLKVIKEIVDMSYMFYECSSLTCINNISNMHNENIIDISFMFYFCKSLTSLPDISKLDIKNVKKMNDMFNGCELLSCLPDISNWNTEKVEDMSNLFKKCKSLTSLPDISKWNIENTEDISSMFSGCLSLSCLPDISKWNIEKVEDMSNLFKKCKSLTFLPDISKWNTENIKNMNDMFFGCSSLSILPDISKWNTDNVTNISGIFYGCSSLSSLPDISGWNFENVEDISDIFNGCSLLISLPEISKWNFKNAEDISNIFKKCKLLKSLPDISKWDTQQVTNMSGIFNGCESLSSLPDISKWNTQNVTDMSWMLGNCTSLSSLPDISKWNIQNLKNSSFMFEGCNKKQFKIPKIFKKKGCLIF